MMRPYAAPSQQWDDFTKAYRNPGKIYRKLMVAAAVIALLLEAYCAFALPDQPTAKIEMEALQ
jgi:hypothetical protein